MQDLTPEARDPGGTAAVGQTSEVQGMLRDVYRVQEEFQRQEEAFRPYLEQLRREQEAFRPYLEQLQREQEAFRPYLEQLQREQEAFRPYLERLQREQEVIHRALKPNGR